jgi:hypothetical protein
LGQDSTIEQGIGTSQQMTKHTPPNTHYILPNQSSDFKFLLKNFLFLFFQRIIQLDSNFGNSNDRKCPRHEQGTKKHQRLPEIKRIKLIIYLSFIVSCLCNLFSILYLRYISSIDNNYIGNGLYKKEDFLDVLLSFY